MAYGVPIVYTASGCASETVGPEAGVLARKNDAEDLAAKIISVLDDASLRSRMSRAARERFKDLFTLAKHLDQMASALTNATAPAGWFAGSGSVKGEEGAGET
jgi:glycosyltransferase involved in cell wall biosynthesis